MNPSITSLQTSLITLVKSFFPRYLFVLLAPLFLATHASGAVITWDAAPVNVDTSDASQIVTTGTLFAALDAYSTQTATSYTVNGVTFTASNANMTVGTTGTWGAGTAPGTGTYTYASILDRAYQMNPSSSSPSNPIQLINLTPGQSYLVQVWTPYWNFNWSTRFGDTAPTGPSYNHAVNESPALNLGVVANSMPAQYLTGTFTADLSGTQNIYFWGTSSEGDFAAIQVRAVPEPQTWALAAAGLSAVFFRLRRKQRVA